jgi:hypothetical protein
MSTQKNSKDMERAQAAFHKKEQQQREGAKAMADYRAGEEAQRAKTEKLRALRLAKEAADREAEAKAPPPVKAVKAKIVKKKR